MTKNYSEKACAVCQSDRIQIGGGYANVSAPRRALGVILIYLPVIFFPFAIFIASMTYLSLRILGASNLKSYWDFVPASDSHRYAFKDQIVMRPGSILRHLGWKTFWQFNCSFYCPMSVGLFEYLTYLVKAVENWWCPFFHERKSDYNCSPIDKSYWHAKPGEEQKLESSDRDCPIWNQDSDLVKIKAKP